MTHAARGHRILVVTNMYPDPPGRPALGIFVQEQVESLRALGLDIDVLFVDGPANKLNYLGGIFRFKQAILRRNYDVVHAHYVFSGMIALTQRRLPVITTFHSGEVLEGSFQRRLSEMVSARSSINIAVSSEVESRLRGRTTVLPCGTDLVRFRPIDRGQARVALGLPRDRRLVLFAAAMRPEKRFDLVEDAMKLVLQSEPHVELVVATNQPPENIPLYMNACDVLVLASRKEGSPQVVKEAMACNLPVVSTDVGDVRDVIGGVAGCHLVEDDATSIAAGIRAALAHGGRTEGRRAVERFSLNAIAEQIATIYDDALRGKFKDVA